MSTRDYAGENKERRRKIKEMHASSDRPSCYCCGKKMVVYRYFDAEFAIKKGLVWGHYGDGIFCSAGCGYKFGLLAVSAGYVAALKQMRGEVGA